MKKSFFFILLLIIIHNFYYDTNAQDKPLEFKSKAKYDLRVLIVPFDPRIYYNDATEIIAKKTGESYRDIMHFFRDELNRALNIALMDSCIVIDLLTEDTRQAHQDISDLYTGISYEMKNAMQNKPEHPDYEEDENFFQKHLSFRSQKMESKTQEIEKTRIEQGEIYQKRESMENKYVHITFTNPEVLKEISRRRGIDLFLFINQFDIKGVYEPYMSGDPDSKRNLRVHFSMYDSRGLLTHGSFGHEEIPFHLDDKQKIVNRYFPEVIRQIIHNIDFSY